MFTGSAVPPCARAAARKPFLTASACMPNAFEPSGSSSARCGPWTIGGSGAGDGAATGACGGCGGANDGTAAGADSGCGGADGGSVLGAGGGSGAADGSAVGGAGELPTASLANAGVPPYSTAAVRGTTSERWSTPQRMGGPAGNGERHY